MSQSWYLLTNKIILLRSAGRYSYKEISFDTERLEIVYHYLSVCQLSDIFLCRIVSLDLLLFYHRYFILSTFVLQSMDFYFLMTKSYFKKIQIKNMWWLICLMYVGKTHLLMCYYNNLNKKSTNNLIRSSSVDNWIY